MNRRDFLKLLPGGLSIVLPGVALAGTNSTDKIVAIPTTAPTASQKTLLQQEPLAGYQYYQADKVWPELRIGDVVEMRREPENKRDTRAIEIYWRNRKLGYVPRETNADLTRRMYQGEKLQAMIIRLTESDEPMERIEMGFYLLNS